MSRLWEPNENYDSFKPAGKYNWPYKRLYKSLTPDELWELLQDAERLHWTALDLSETGIDTLPDSIGYLSNLQWLYLGGRELSNLQLYFGGTSLRALPDSIGNLSKLQWLSLCNCKFLHALPDSIGNLSNLQGLDLRDCKSLRALPDSIGNLSNLQWLYLDSCENLRGLPDSIGNLSKLELLDLRGCHLKSLPYSLVKLKAFENGEVYLEETKIDELDLNMFGPTREEIEAYLQRMQPPPQPPKEEPVKPAPLPPPKEETSLKTEKKTLPTPENDPLLKEEQRLKIAALREDLKSKKLNTFYLYLKIVLVIAAVAALIALFGWRPELLKELLQWLF